MGATHPYDLPARVHEALRNHGVVLTPNQRAARTLRRRFDERMRIEGRELWESPRVLPLETWIADLWHRMLLEGSDSRFLLNPAQERHLWRAVIAADPGISGLHSVDALTDMASRGWRLLHLHNGRSRLAGSGATAESRAFERWATNFEKRCAQLLCLTQAELPGECRRALTQGLLPINNDGLTLLDFDSLPPAFLSLFDSVRLAGHTVDALDSSLESPSSKLFPAPDSRCEVRAAALWTREQLKERPDIRLAVVVPDLEQRRPELERIFGQILAPEQHPITASPQALPFEFSLGKPLAQTSAGAIALDLLRWPLRPLSLESISSLLLSPYFGAGDASDPEALAIAAFDAYELRQGRRLRPELSLDAMVNVVEQSPRRVQLSRLRAQLRAMQRVAASSGMLASSPESEPRPQRHATWSDSFRDLLLASGWTKAASANSMGFQTYRRWENTLDQLSTLDFDGARVSASAALEALTRIVQHIIFAPESHDAPVQLLGPLELGGASFDGLWFLGADDLSWPPSASPHPLIPGQIQRALGMPGTIAAVDRERAQTVTMRIASAAANVVFSYAQHTEEGERHASAAIKLLASEPFDPASLPDLYTRLDAEPFAIADDDAPLPSLPDAVLPGGAKVLELQAACGFRAFAERRLWSSELQVAEPGLDARDRGTDVHRILQMFWTRVVSQAALRELPRAQRESVLEECIAETLQKTETRASTPWETAYISVQRQRLRKLLRPWLDFELQRPDFTVLAQEEAAHNIAIGPLKLDLRVDRIDQTAGGLLILDYKTGSATPSEWLSNRPDAPQLPLYSLLPDPHDLGGVAFALVRAGKDLALKGFSADPAVLAQSARMSTPTFAAQVEQWRVTLTQLASAFAEGDARVEPKCYPKTCSRCAQRVLCRLDPTTLEDVGEEEDDYGFSGASSSFEEVTYG